jgi:ketosteroid isomerase-like protein
MSSFEGEPPSFTVTNLISDGDFVIAYGDMKMKEKDGKTAPYAYCDIYRFRGDKIIEMRSFVVKTEAKSESTAGAL